MATSGFLVLEFFAKVGGGWQSLGTKTFYPNADAAGIQTIDQVITLPCGSSIGDPSGNEFRVVVVGSGNGVTTDKITALTSVSWQVDSTTPTEVGITQGVRATVTPVNA